MVTQTVTKSLGPELNTVKPYCLIPEYGDGPFYALLTILMSLQVSRYFLIKNMNKFKEHISVEKDPKSGESLVVEVVSFRFKLFKLLASPLCNIIICIIYYLISHSIKIPISIIFPCPSAQGYDRIITPNHIYSITLFYGCMAWIVLVWLLDVFANIRYCKKPWFFFIGNDPYYFRLELFLWVLFLVGASTLNTITMTENARTSSTVVGEILYALGQLLQPTIFSAVCLVITLIKSRSSGEYESTTFTVETVMKNADLAPLFKQFAQKEWSVENVRMCVKFILNHY